ncbi:patatin-like phospholipase family protein [Saccharicrinis fermentans]|uniref:Patatin-like phospholipase n=1 Tax=Saccharicrinis fermentans DSM 9555 = JCM 21142 TaxID=869213 RepID=W7YBG8_9BACT|nr:patatin family protein [Saccharicrinis fermentans]GAF01766.1 patatin-like phospholipase [Saccharicrinis fermentans DSM 9555 = JCM 21142]
MNNKTALVLEGGGFRGLYTAGILHRFSENNLEFPFIIAVSMGASNATNYLAKQTQRNLDVPYTFVNDKRYMSYARLLTGGALFGIDFIFVDIPKKLIPFDFKTFTESKQKLIYVTTDCCLGKPYYVLNTSMNESFKALEASTSLPFVSKMVPLHNRLLLDGGITDPIPVEKAMEEGYEKLVVILTQPKEFRKKAIKAKRLTHMIYKKYPQLAEAILKRHIKYNKQLDLVEQLEAEGKAFVFRPNFTLPVSRTEQKKEKLKETFDIGCRQGDVLMNKLLSFLD